MVGFVKVGLGEVRFVLKDGLALVVDDGLAVGDPSHRAVCERRIGLGLDLLDEGLAGTVGVLEAEL